MFDDVIFRFDAAFRRRAAFAAPPYAMAADALFLLLPLDYFMPLLHMLPRRFRYADVLMMLRRHSYADANMPLRIRRTAALTLCLCCQLPPRAQRAARVRYHEAGAIITD